MQARRKSIDAALLRLAAPLPANFRAADLSSGPAPAPGDAITLAGFGVTRPGEPKTGGVLRRAALRAREPISALLLWAEGEGPGVGACSGDSGAPLLAADGSLVAIVAWVDGGDRRGCGGVTQGPLVRPLRPWIDGVIGRWNGREPPG